MGLNFDLFGGGGIGNSFPKFSFMGVGILEERVYTLQLTFEAF